MKHSLVSILIVNWNTRELTLGCLDSLSDAAANVRYEVVVVDNGSSDGSAEALAERMGLHLILNEANLGFAAAVNQAYRVSSGELVLLLNSDVEFTPGSLETLVRFLEHHPDAAGVAPLYLNPDGSPQPFHFQFPSFAMTLANGSALLRRVLPGSQRRLREYKMLDIDFSEPRTVPQPSASCLLLRRSCLPAETVLDERYPIFFNDVQLARKLAAQGYSLWVTPEAVVIHEAHASSRQLGASIKRQYLGSLIRMLAETESPLKVWLYRATIALQNVGLWALRDPGALRRGDLGKALAGDPGPLPSQPAR